MPHTIVARDEMVGAKVPIGFVGADLARGPSCGAPRHAARARRRVGQPVGAAVRFRALVYRRHGARRQDAAFSSLEVTETAVMDDVDFVISTIRDPNTVGLRRSIDSFRAGYDSLSCMKQFSGRGEDRRVLRPDSRYGAAAAAVTGMAGALGLSVLAQGSRTTGGR